MLEVSSDSFPRPNVRSLRAPQRSSSSLEDHQIANCLGRQFAGDLASGGSASWGPREQRPEEPEPGVSPGVSSSHKVACCRATSVTGSELLAQGGL
eukprot:1195761-Prorocentrum_minimum.AAC.4